MARLRQLLKTTAVRLTLLYTLIFGLFAAGLVAYFSYNTGRLIISQVEAAATDEMRELAFIYNRRGPLRLIRSIESRSRNPGANIYLVSDGAGRIIAGNVRSVDTAIFETSGWINQPFAYSPFTSTGNEDHQAIGRVFTLSDGLVLLVGRDIGDAKRFRGIVFQAFTVTMALLFLLALVSWFIIGRRALKQIDAVSKSSARIMAGDLSQRLPVSGVGDEFDRLSANLNTIIARVEKLNTGVSNMSDSIAHDLKTPLTRLRNRAEAALSDELVGKDDANSVLAAIVQDADGLIRTFDSLLMISQVGSGARTVSMDMLDLSAVARDVVELFEPLLEEGEVELSVDFADPVKISANRELIAQAITNLIDNALKHASNASSLKLTLSTQVKDSGAVLTFSDNGPGIPTEERQRVLERFVRLDRSRSTPGSGLGLALVDAVVSLHGGTLELGDAEPGLLVTMTFPLPSSVG